MVLLELLKLISGTEMVAVEAVAVGLNTGYKVFFFNMIIRLKLFIVFAFLSFSFIL